jgi:DNA-binding MarR family transcriptional regulator
MGGEKASRAASGAERAGAGSGGVRPGGSSPPGAGTRALAMRLHSAAIRLLRRVRRTDASMGLSPARASVLSVLVFGGPRTIGELAAVEQVRPPTMTRLVTGLEAGGYVERTADPRDGRSVMVRATAKGRRTLERGRRLRVAQIEAMLGGVSGEEAATLAEAVTLLERELGRAAREE